MFKEEPGQGVAEGMTPLALDQSEHHGELVNTLLASCELELKAQVGPHRFVFPFEVAPTLEGRVQLQLALPHTYEGHNNIRSWRFQPRDDELRLCDYQDHFSDPVVVDISKSGICIRDTAPRLDPTIPTHHLTLHLPEYDEPVSLRCNLVRFDDCPHTADAKLIAFRFSEDSPQVSATISRFLFSRHRRIAV
ncbi:MAG: PilZ domain-containing protein [Candidatus Sedimenticola endophacoides]